MSTLQFTVPGPPRPKQRARRGAAGHWYTPPETVRFETAVGLHGAVARMRAAWPKADRCTKYELWINAFFPDDRGRDIDNVAKAVMDSLNCTIWNDDRQVVRLVVERHVDRTAPRTEIAITQMEQVTLNARGAR